MQVTLAIFSGCGCDETMAAADSDARLAGLTGAEIDQALAGRSFSARESAAVSLACAMKSENADEIAAARTRAETFGLCPIEIEQVEDLVRDLLYKLEHLHD
jgi:hypothetical protein